MNIIHPRHPRPSAPDGFGDGVRPPARTPRRRARTLVLGALIPATFAAGLVTAATATASTPDTATHAAQVQVTQPQYTRGFHVWNGGTYNLKLVSMDGDYDSTPNIGHILPPQGTDDFEATFWFGHDNDAHATYDILDAQGAKIGTYTADMTVYSGAGATTSGCSISMGYCTPNPPQDLEPWEGTYPLNVHEN
jgi:hypothetical protein